MKITRRQLRQLIRENSLLLEVSKEEIARIQPYSPLRLTDRLKNLVPGIPNYEEYDQVTIKSNGDVVISPRAGRDDLKTRVYSPSQVTLKLYNNLLKSANKKRDAEEKKKKSEERKAAMDELLPKVEANAGFYKVSGTYGGKQYKSLRIAGGEGAGVLFYAEENGTRMVAGLSTPGAISHALNAINGVQDNETTDNETAEGETDTSAQKQNQPRQQNNSNVPGRDGKIKYIQKAIGDKVDGKWNRSKQGNKETDDKWKEWLNANDKRHLNCIGFNGNQKLESGQEIDRNTLKKAFEDNDAGALAQVAGYKNSLTGVYKMVKDVVDLKEKEIVNRSALYDLGGDKTDEDDIKEGEEDVSAEKVEAVKVASSPEAIAEVDKIKDPKRRKGWYRKTLERLDKMIDKAIEKNDQKAVKELRGRRKIFGKKAKEEGVKEEETSSGSSSDSMSYEDAIKAAKAFVGKQANPKLFGIGEGNGKSSARTSATTDVVEKIYGSKSTTSGNATTTRSKGKLQGIEIVKTFNVNPPKGTGANATRVVVVIQVSESNLQTLEEMTLSRGSLYRRRYYGRY